MCKNVGKRSGNRIIRQEEINFLMVTLASSGRRVLRLKSGDPLIFGRAGEEIEALRRASIEYEIVPGVTSAFGGAAAAGIPLTHRRAASTVVMTAGHRAPENLAEDWRTYAGGESTLVIYMPGSNYAEISSRLTGAGFAQETPCAIISRQRLQNSKCIEPSFRICLGWTPRLASPTLLVVGEVVRFADHGWAEETANFPHPENALAAAFSRSGPIPTESLRKDEEPLA